LGVSKLYLGDEVEGEALIDKEALVEKVRCEEVA
jgi:hypothetical protein